MSLLKTYQSDSSVLHAFTKLVIVINCSQNLVDCDNAPMNFGNGNIFQNKGCHGGYAFLATMYAQNNGLAYRSDYKYVEVSKKCQNGFANP